MLKNRNVLAWVLLLAALGLHVIDEAAHDFLSFYNPLVEDLRTSWGFFPMPTFSYEVWIIGLIFVIILGFLITPLVNRGGRIIRRFYVALGIVMVLNGLAHILASIRFGELVPGVWSSPVLFVIALYAVVRGIGREGWVRKQALSQ